MLGMSRLQWPSGFSRMESKVLVDSHELTAAMKSDQF